VYTVGVFVLLVGIGSVFGFVEKLGVGLASGVSTLDVKWSFNASGVFPRVLFGAGSMTGPTVWDVDGDGRNEILFSTRRGHSRRLWCIGQDGSFEWVYPPIEQEGLPGDPTSKVSLVDVDNDGVYEICFGGQGGRLYVLNHDGTVKWTWDDPNTDSLQEGPPQALDVDGDGFVDFFVNDGAGYVYRLDHTGRLVYRSFSTVEALSAPTIADIDQDGRFEVLWTGGDHRVHCMDADTGEERWSLDVGADMQFVPVVVADVNGDGRYEAVVWTDPPTSSVICMSSDGREVSRWTDPGGGTIRMVQAMGDVDGDGLMEMVVMTDHAGFCIDIGKERPATRWRVDFANWSASGVLPAGAVADMWSSYQLIADVDGDGGLEVLWLAPFPIVTDALTGRLEAYYLNPHVAVRRRQEAGAWWGDVDGDGASEWIAELNGRSHVETQLYCLTMGGHFPASSPWPEYYHSAYPAEYQARQRWLTLKAAYSNSLWFPITEVGLACTAVWGFAFAVKGPLRRLAPRRGPEGSGT